MQKYTSFFYGKQAALLIFKNKFITNDGLDLVWNLINPHSTSYKQEYAPPCYTFYFDEKNKWKRTSPPIV
jgi:hypothetical protein